MKLQITKFHRRATSKKLKILK